MRHPTISKPVKFAAAAVGLSLALAACGGSGDAATTTAASAATTTTTATATTVAQTETTAAQAVAKVNANTASTDEIVAALQAAGVGNADRWAREVVEYRPYDTSDPDLTHLRDELAKYNPAAGVVDEIVSALEL